MKKLLAILLTGIISISCAVAFTACGGEQKGTTVTEDEWKTALSYLTIKVDENSSEFVQLNPRTNFICKELVKSNTDEHTYEVITSCDFKNIVSRLQFINDGENDSDGYAWQEGDTYYDVGIALYTDSISYHKRERSVDELYIPVAFAFEQSIYAYAGGMDISATNMAQNYDMFTYSEERAEYTATLHYKGENRESDTFVTAKFENGMLSYLSVDFGESSYSYTYTYGTTITVPENIRNLPLGETIIPKN